MFLNADVMAFQDGHPKIVIATEKGHYIVNYLYFSN